MTKHTLAGKFLTQGRSLCSVRMPHMKPVSFQQLVCLAAISSYIMFGFKTAGMAQTSVQNIPLAGGIQERKSADDLTPEELKKRLQLWEEACKEVTTKEKCAAFIDLTRAQNDVPPNLAYAQPAGLRAMRALARALHLQYKQAGGIQTFFQGDSSQNAWLNRDIDYAIRAMAGMNDKDFKALLDGTLYLSDTDDPVREAFERIGGAERDMNYVMLDQYTKMRVQLSIYAKVKYIDNAASAFKVFDLISPPHSGKNLTPVVSPQPKAATITVLAHPVRGELDFGPGSVMPLSQILKTASKAFNCAYELDPRIKHMVCFVSGSMTRPVFETSLALISNVPPVRPVSRTHENVDSDIEAIRDRARSILSGQQLDVTALRMYLNLTPAQNLQMSQTYGQQETLDYAAILGQSSLIASQFSHNKPGVTNVLTTVGISQTTNITLLPGFILRVFCTGKHGVPSIGGEGQYEAANETVVLLH